MFKVNILLGQAAVLKSNVMFCSFFSSLMEENRSVFLWRNS